MEATIISPGYRYRRLRYSPFEHLTPFHHQSWCRHCKEAVDTVTHKGRWENVEVYKVSCLRCGQTMFHGIDRRLLTSPRPDVMQAAVRFIKLRGRDRR